MHNFQRYKITEIAEIRYKVTGEPYYLPREVNVVRGGARLGHYVLDYIILQGISYLLGYMFGSLMLADTGSMATNELIVVQLKMAGLGLLYNFMYYAAFEGFFGSTPGKMLLGRVVIDEYGERPDFPRVMLRSVIRWVPFEALSCLSPRGWHDQWSKTFVVSKQEADLLWDALAKMETEVAKQDADRFRSQQGSI